MNMDLTSLLPLVLTPDPRGFNQGATEPSEPALDPCSLLSERHYEVVPCVICALCCIFGVVYCCFGYRCFKAIMFLSGLLFGSAVIFLLCYKERILDTQLSLEVSAGIALGIGVLCGLVTMLVHSVGLFLTGLLLGLLVATAGLVATEPLYELPSAWVPAGSLLGSALLGAVLALRWQKTLTVVSTAVFGGAVLTLCLDYAVENLALGRHVYDRLRLGPSSLLCWCGWAVLATWPVLALMGVLLQWKVTAEGFSHTDVVLNRRQKQLQLLRIRQREAKKRQSQAPQEGSYRHKPSAVKRCAGDVLAPFKQTREERSSEDAGEKAVFYVDSSIHGSLLSVQGVCVCVPEQIPMDSEVRLYTSYIQSLRDRQQLGTGTSLSSLSTNAHTTVDLDYDCGSTVPLTTPRGCL